MNSAKYLTIYVKDVFHETLKYKMSCQMLNIYQKQNNMSNMGNQMNMLMKYGPKTDFLKKDKYNLLINK